MWGYEPSVEAMEGLLHLFAHDRSLIGPDLARLRYEASVRPGVQEAYRAMFPAPRQRALDALTHPRRRDRGDHARRRSSCTAGTTR